MYKAVFISSRGTQTALVKSKFVEAIQNYQSVEQQYRTKYKQRMERQYKIGKLMRGELEISPANSFYSETRCHTRRSESCCE